MEINSTIAGWQRRVLNLVWYQAIWFSAVLGGNTWIGLAGLLLAIHLYRVDDWREQVLLMLAAGAIGGTVDGFLTRAGVFSFSTSTPGGLAPYWVFVIWMGFAGTLRHSLAWLAARPRLMTLAALFGAPMAYSSAARLGAVEFPLGSSATLLMVSLSWLCVLPILLAINHLLRVHVGAASSARADRELV